MAEAKTVLVAEINGVITVGTLELFEASLEEDTFNSLVDFLNFIHDYKR